ncbi:hypothetical protein EXIGLDRAFT_759147 [Exidia glandulosa HHB12029]|uniref:Poly [ADP-ribose] polymerase n=1 Tax=Exidia glandulosa HHB12029 TaxID=1314781 RepID=A0A165Q9B3_EXIGL|nr:hypothetical protein EXIGLDRAFT_759147 [Exidia glandulosa HHB12029]
MPPRRAAAAKAAAANKPASKSKKPASTAKPKSKGKRKRDEVSDAEEDGDDNADEDKADDDADAATDGPGPSKKVKKGTAPVDKFSGMDSAFKLDRGGARNVLLKFVVMDLGTHKVYVGKDGEIYDATLNQTNIGNNNNKFYCLQLLHPEKSSATCVLFTRWGRVGENGASQTKGPFPAEVAVKEFQKQFKNKACCHLDARTAKPKEEKYTWIDMQYDDEEDESAKADGGAAKPREKTPDSVLDKPVKDIIDFIFNENYISQHLGSFNYDANKLPLGKLSKDTVANGYSVLKEIAEALENKDSGTDAASGSSGPKRGAAKKKAGNVFVELTNRYYSIIPHAFGRSKPTVIDTQDLLKQEVDLVGTLAELEETSGIMSGHVSKKEHPTDANLHSLELDEIAPVDVETDEFKALEAYCKETYAYGNYGQKMTLENMFRIERRGERQRWLEGGWDDLPNAEDGTSPRLLLFHGSRSSNFGGILKNGLKIAPPEAPHNGYLQRTTSDTLLDMLKLSAGYTYSGLSDNVGLVLLCEVAAKPYLHRIKNTQFAADECKAAKKTLFKTEATDHAEWVDAGKATGNSKIDGVLMPDVSNIQERAKSEPWWSDNMYVAYDVSQVRLRYLLKMKFGS